MLLFFAIVLITFGYLWLKHRYTYWERHGVKGPRPVFFFGNLFKSLTLQEHVSVAHSRWYNAFKDVPYIGFYKLLQPAVMIQDPELQREILVKAFMSFHENDAKVSEDDDLREPNPFFNTGEKWQRGRTYLGTCFSANKIRQVFAGMLQVGREWEKYVRSHGENAEFDAKDICSRYTIETTVRSTFSIHANSFEQESEFIDMLKSILTPDLGTAMKMLINFFIQEFLKFFNVTLVPPIMSNRFKQIVRDQIKVRDSGRVQCEDVLQTLLNGREKYGLSEIEIAASCFGFFMEAYDSAPNTLVSALYQLAKNPHIQDELARCIEESIVANNNEITYDIIQKHEYLDKVVYESLRCQPSVFGLIKICTKDYTMPLLPNQKVPVTIPTKTPIVLNFASVYQDPAYFPDPEVFDPERFSPEQKTMRPKATFMPFGDGPRMCIGMQLGLFNLKIGLFEMIRRFDIQLGPNHKPFELHPMTISLIPKDGIKLTFTPRKMA